MFPNMQCSKFIYVKLYLRQKIKQHHVSRANLTETDAEQQQRKDKSTKLTFTNIYIYIYIYSCMHTFVT
jgi:hypothetical protein